MSLNSSTSLTKLSKEIKQSKESHDDITNNDLNKDTNNQFESPIHNNNISSAREFHKHKNLNPIAITIVESNEEYCPSFHYNFNSQSEPNLTDLDKHQIEKFDLFSDDKSRKKSNNNSNYDFGEEIHDKSPQNINNTSIQNYQMQLCELENEKEELEEKNKDLELKMTENKEIIIDKEQKLSQRVI